MKLKGQGLGFYQKKRKWKRCDQIQGCFNWYQEEFSTLI